MKSGRRPRSGSGLAAGSTMLESLPTLGRAPVYTLRPAPTPSPNAHGAALGADGCARLRELVFPLSDAIVRAGDLPMPNPLGLSWP